MRHRTGRERPDPGLLVASRKHPCQVIGRITQSTRNRGRGKGAGLRVGVEEVHHQPQPSIDLDDRNELLLVCRPAQPTCLPTPLSRSL